MSKRIVLYLRVSTDGQTTKNQQLELEQIAERNDWTIVDIFEDHGISGAGGRDSRPAYDRMLKAAVRKEFDLIAAWSVDRLGRSLQHLVSFLSEIHAKGVGLYLHQQALDTSTPSGMALFQMSGVFAEYERSILRSRIISGLNRARSQNIKLGRPTIEQSKEDRIRSALIKGGKGIRKLAAEYKVGVSVVQRIKNSLPA